MLCSTPRACAFTYVELTVVLTIVAILAAIAVPNFLEAQTRSVVSRSKAEQAVLKMAIEEYRLENKSYPLNRISARPGPWDLTVLTTPVVYIGRLPEDPFTTLAHHKRDRAMKQPLPYLYYNGLQTNPEKGLIVKEGIGFKGTGFIAAITWGRGGSGVSWPEAETMSTSVSKTGELTLLSYDATNGTSSPGDIYTRIP